MSETEDLFCEVQNEGMDFIGVKIQFEMDGGSYVGTLGNPDAATQMLTGGYQGRSQVIIMATRSQFASRPAQKGIVVITAPDIFSKSQWQRKQVDVFGASHYAIEVMMQLPTT